MVISFVERGTIDIQYMDNKFAGKVEIDAFFFEFWRKGIFGVWVVEGIIYYWRIEWLYTPNMTEIYIFPTNMLRFT